MSDFVEILNLLFSPDDDPDFSNSDDLDNRSRKVAELVFLNELDDRAIEAEISRKLAAWNDNDIVELISFTGFYWLQNAEMKAALREILTRVRDHIRVRRISGPLLPFID